MLGLDLKEFESEVQVKVTQSYLMLCNPMDYIPIPHGIIQARILERVAFPFSRGYSQPRDQTQALWELAAFLSSLLEVIC